jgi:Dolichyl-phosphate-mannose-protein mannosyltransferase
MRLFGGVSAMYACLNPRAEKSLDLALLGIAWTITASIVDPSGNFPLNDDWAYARTVRHLIDSGDYHPLENTTMTLATNVLWGSLFSICSTGLDFVALRSSTLFASFLGIAGIYIFVREFRQSRQLALCAAATVAFNPLYFSLSFTFMTDVLFAVLCIWAILFFSRNLQTGALLDSVLGTAISLAATLSRQLGICIPLAFCIVRLLVPQPRGTKVLVATIPALTCGGALILFLHWLRVTGKLPTLYGLQMQGVVQSFMDVKVLMWNVVNNEFVVSAYLGLFLLPLLLLSVGSLLRTRAPRGYIAIGIGALLVVAGACARSRAGLPMLMPLLSNIMIKSGIGPLTLRDTYLLELDNVPSLPFGFWFIVTLLSLIGSVLLVARLIAELLGTVGGVLSNLRLEPSNSYSFFGILCGGTYLLPLLPSPFIYDRYLIPAAIFFLFSIACGTVEQRRRASPIVALLALSYLVMGALCWYSLTGTRDYLAWNRLRWGALRELTLQRLVPATEIDGGYEFNGLFLYDPNYDVLAHLNDTHKSYWWVQNDTYMIAFGPVPGYKVICKYTERSWRGQTYQVVVLKKIKLVR